MTPVASLSLPVNLRPDETVPIDEIRKSSRSVVNRVQSIIADAQYVQAVQAAYALPLVANKRCGLWYIAPENRKETSYFKSTDGHTTQWAFSLRRLNLHLLPFIQAHAGAILVDSTRRGKRMPDAFSKTVPIWCAVINRAVFGSSELHTPPRVVSDSERQQIMDRIDKWTLQLKETVPAHLYQIDKPLRPLWVTQDGALPFEAPHFKDMYPVVLCTASQRAQDGELVCGYSYVQGAADDHELWAGKLTPDLLWAHSDLREMVSDAELINRINSRAELKIETLTITQLSPYLSVGTIDAVKGTPTIDLKPGSKWALADGKKGARQLAAYLDDITNYYEEIGPYCTILASEGTDFAVSVALLLDCLFFDDNGFPCARRKGHVSKDQVAKRLVLLAANAGGAPSRTTINIIGSYLRK